MAKEFDSKMITNYQIMDQIYLKKTKIAFISLLFEAKARLERVVICFCA